MSDVKFEIMIILLSQSEGIKLISQDFATSLVNFAFNRKEQIQ